MHHDRGVCLRSAQQPADPIGSTRRPIICSGTPGPARSMTPTPSKPGTNGNVVREAYAPETVTASEGFTAAAIIRTLTSCGARLPAPGTSRSEEHTSELQSRGHLVCRLLLEKKKNMQQKMVGGKV